MFLFYPNFLKLFGDLGEGSLWPWVVICVDCTFKRFVRPAQSGTAAARAHAPEVAAADSSSDSGSAG